MHRVRLILVGGFLGAGKTTLLARAARVLVRQGKKVGLITNDQAGGLVDTELLKQEGSGVGEVSGGCFCCRFHDLISSLKRLFREIDPDVLIGEPVGSCTDLSATVLQPLKKLYGEIFSMAPFSVLVDPARLRESLNLGAESTFPDSVLYILRKQLEEADLIVLNKADRLSSAKLGELKSMVAEKFPGRPVLAMSALEGDGVDAWLDFVMQDRPAGQRITDVDYDTYAEGEALLGWLNATVRLRAQRPTDWSRFCLDLLERIRKECQTRSAEIAHVKLFLEAEGESLVANLTSTEGEALLRGSIGGEGLEAKLFVNARVRMSPDDLRGAVERCLQAAAGDEVTTEVARLQSFSPARPQPTHRFDSVV